MNFRLIAKLLGVLSAGLGLAMLPSLGVAMAYGEPVAQRALGLSAALSFAFGSMLILLGRKASKKIYSREALCLVAMAWLVASALGAMPFIFSGTLGPVDALFESSSGFSTTGSSVLTDVEGTAKGVLFWRSFTHWLGGAGIIVLFITVLPYLGAGGKLLFKSESSGPDKSGFTPRIKDTAIVVWRIYVGLTVAITVAYLFAGMRLFEALCHTFGGISSGGFSTRQMSIMAYDSVSIEVIAIISMLCAGTSFATFFAIAKGDWKAPFKDTEWKLFIGLLVLFSLGLAFNLTGAAGTFINEHGNALDRGTQYPSFWTALRYSTFSVISQMTNTGFVAADFDAWPEFSRMMLIAISFLGGCAGSTTAGLKIVRVIILAKVVYARVESTFRPKVVRAIRVNGEVVSPEVQTMVFAFAALLITWFVLGSLLLCALGVPFQTAVSAVAVTLNGTGPGLEHVGPILDFHLIPTVGKLFLSLTMISGRLEVFTLFVLLVPAFWRKD